MIKWELEVAPCLFECTELEKSFFFSHSQPTIYMYALMIIFQ